MALHHGNGMIRGQALRHVRVERISQVQALALVSRGVHLLSDGATVLRSCTTTLTVRR